MKISAIEEYGLRCLVQLARRGERRSVSVSELARDEGLSVPYVGKLMRQLRQAGLVTSERGQAGGYALAREAAAIRLDEALRALSEPIYYPGFCTEHAGHEEVCVHVSDCGLRAVWREVQSAVDEVTARVTLADLVTRERVLQTRLDEQSGRAPTVNAGANVNAALNAGTNRNAAPNATAFAPNASPASPASSGRHAHLALAPAPLVVADSCSTCGSCTCEVEPLTAPRLSISYPPRSAP